MEELKQPEQSNVSKTYGELLFERYMRNVGITDFDIEKSFPESSKKPDYTFLPEGNTLLLERQRFSRRAEGPALVEVLENVACLKSRPAEMMAWNEAWSQAHALFAYETFLYVTAALLKTKSYTLLHETFATTIRFARLRPTPTNIRTV